MKQNVTIALLAIVATLLAVQIFSPSRIVIGQQGGGGTATVAGDIAVATGTLQGANGSAFWLFDKAKNKLAIYVLGNAGLEVRAVRDIQYDLGAIDFSLNNGKQNPPVKAMSTAIKNASNASKKKADEE